VGILIICSETQDLRVFDILADAPCLPWTPQNPAFGPRQKLRISSCHTALFWLSQNLQTFVNAELDISVWPKVKKITAYCHTILLWPVVHLKYDYKCALSPPVQNGGQIDDMAQITSVLDGPTRRMVFIISQTTWWPKQPQYLMA
jgi:hypothetical protein